MRLPKLTFQDVTHPEQGVTHTLPTSHSILYSRFQTLYAGVLGVTLWFCFLPGVFFVDIFSFFQQNLNIPGYR